MITMPTNLIESRMAVEQVEAAGIAFVWIDNIPTTDDDVTAQAVIDSIDYVALLKAEKISELKSEGLSRLQAIYPAIDSFDMLEIVSEIILSILPAARDLTVDMTSLSTVYQAGLSARIAINALSTLTEVDTYDVVNSPSWP